MVLGFRGKLATLFTAICVMTIHLKYRVNYPRLFENSLSKLRSHPETFSTCDLQFGFKRGNSAGFWSAKTASTSLHSSKSSPVNYIVKHKFCIMLFTELVSPPAGVGRRPSSLDKIILELSVASRLSS